MKIQHTRQTIQQASLRPQQTKQLGASPNEKKQLAQVHQLRGVEAQASNKPTPSYQDVQEIKGQFVKQSAEAQINRPSEMAPQIVGDVSDKKAEVAASYEQTSSLLKDKTIGRGIDDRL